MSSRHTTLEDYLGNRLSPPKKHAQRPLHLHNHQYMESGTAANRKFFANIQRTVEPNIESWQTTFNQSRRQCQQQLQRLLQNITNEEYFLVMYLEQYEKQVEVEMEEEFVRIKQQLIALIDRSFEENKKRIRDGFHLQGARELTELQRIRQRLTNIKKQIEEYMRSLEGTTYKKSIANIVMTDFQSEGHALMEQVASILMQYEDKVYLRIDGVRFSRIRDDIASLIEYAERKDGPGSAGYVPSPAPAVHSGMAAAGLPNGIQGSLLGGPPVLQNMPPLQSDIGITPSLRPSGAFGNTLSPNIASQTMVAGSIVHSVRQNAFGSLPPTLMNPNLHRNRDLLQSSPAE